MGLSNKLKTQSRLLLSIAVFVIVIVGVGIAFVALSVPTQKAAVTDVFQDDVYAEDSDAGGQVDIGTTLRDSSGKIIRRTEPDSYATPFQIIDPTSDTEVGTYSIELSFDCWGKNIDFSTFKMVATWKLTSYIGVDDIGNPAIDSPTANTALDTWTIEAPPVIASGDKELTNGEKAFREVGIDSLMPDILYPPAGGGENFPQRTAWSHEMTFVFDWGNTYDSHYNIHVALCLVWAGSDFEINWDEGSTTTTTSTSTTTTPTGTTTTQPPTTTDPELPPLKTTTPTEDIPIKDDFGDPTDDPTSDERVYVTNEDTQDVLAASLTGGTGSLMLVVVILGILVPIILYWKFVKK
jgi:hypothetical protein